MTDELRRLVESVTSWLPVEPPPTSADIERILGTMAAAFRIGDEVAKLALEILLERFSIRMDKGTTIVSEVEHAPWLDSRRAEIDPFYWSRYRQYLIQGGWPPLVAATLDRATDEMVDLLGNPADERPWRRRGLVVGDVQSGKTATYCALICKAADAGYRMVILLTGMLENVRRQTQARMDAGFVGLDSADFLRKSGVRHKTPIGVGVLNPARDGIVFTSRDADFRKNAATALNISIGSVSEPVLVVMKKNRAVLNRLADWLRGRNADRSGRIPLPLLLIDDEADNASINTRKDPSEATAINAAIRDLLRLFERSSYVGFTATPFANIFVDPDTTDEMLGNDVFPSDFIHVLKAPDNYVGMEQVFGRPAEEDADGREAGSDGMLRPIEDAEMWMPLDHRKDHIPQDVPPSLRKALEAFLLACAIRDLRGPKGGIHRSMLVNASRFTDVQNRVADALKLELEEIRTAVRLYGGLPPSEALTRSPVIGRLAGTFTEEFAACGFPWERVLAALHAAIAPVRIQPVNQSTGSASLDYAAVPEGLRVIAVGGNSLSRGLTLEGLSTTWFLRNPTAYDTLMQMGRWFGYRDGYRDLCRIWMTDEARGWYEHVTDATLELKRDFESMRRRRATPREFGLRVRTHPDTLLITARNKMATGMDVDVRRDISLDGRGVESSRLYADRARNLHNVAALDRFFGGLAAQGIAAAGSPHGGALIWQAVPAPMIAGLLEEFAVHPLNFDFQSDTLAEFILQRSGAAGALASWTVAMPSQGDAGGLTEFPSLACLAANAARRRVKPGQGVNSLLVSGRSARVGGRADLRHAFGKAEFSALKAQERHLRERDLREAMTSPLMVIYPIRGVVTEGGGVPDAPWEGGLLLPALGLHFPGLETTASDATLVRYRLNRVAQRDLFGVQEDGDDVAGEDDEA